MSSCLLDPVLGSGFLYCQKEWYFMKPYKDFDQRNVLWPKVFIQKQWWIYQVHFFAIFVEFMVLFHHYCGSEGWYFLHDGELQWLNLCTNGCTGQMMRWVNGLSGLRLWGFSIGTCQGLTLRCIIIILCRPSESATVLSSGMITSSPTRTSTVQASSDISSLCLDGTAYFPSSCFSAIFWIYLSPAVSCHWTSVIFCQSCSQVSY